MFDLGRGSWEQGGGVLLLRVGTLDVTYESTVQSSRESPGAMPGAGVRRVSDTDVLRGRAVLQGQALHVHVRKIV